MSASGVVSVLADDASELADEPVISTKEDQFQ